MFATVGAISTFFFFFFFTHTKDIVILERQVYSGQFFFIKKLIFRSFPKENEGEQILSMFFFFFLKAFYHSFLGNRSLLSILSFVDNVFGFWW